MGGLCGFGWLVVVMWFMVSGLVISWCLGWYLCWYCSGFWVSLALSVGVGFCVRWLRFCV